MAPILFFALTLTFKSQFNFELKFSSSTSIGEKHYKGISILGIVQ